MTEQTTHARRFVVRGRVQGVGFRWFVEREARVLGIAGWVRNNADSSVEVLGVGTRPEQQGWIMSKSSKRNRFLVLLHSALKEPGKCRATRRR